MKILDTKLRKESIKTQILVGFPGETEDDFRKSEELFGLGLFDYVEVYAYTDRRGTKAANLPDHVSKEIVTRRYRKLLWKSFVGNFLKGLVRAKV